VLTRQKHGFKRPDRPEGNERDPRFVLGDDAILLVHFQLKVVEQQRPMMCGKVFGLCDEFSSRFAGDVLGGPYLAMRMGIAGAHHGTAVLKDLNVTDV
jgi:hypothetical protein